MFKKPNLFILGAPKCGTTSLAYWLSQHPNIYMSERKEPDFFNTDGLQRITKMSEYELLFECVNNSHTVVGEASTHYLYSKEAVPNILDYNSDASFIVCLRNPMKMVQALHGERVFQGAETITSFKDAWEAQHDRLNGNNIPLAMKNDPERLQYGRYCKLGEQVIRLKSIAKEEKIHTVLLEDMSKDPKKEYVKILNFLNIPIKINTDFPVLNTSKAIKFPYVNNFLKTLGNVKRSLRIKLGFGLAHQIKQLNLKNEKRGKLSPQLKKGLINYFREDIKLLSNTINRDLGHWLIE